MKCVRGLIFIFALSSVGAFEDKVVDTLRDVRSNGRMSDQCTNALALYIENLNSTTDDPWALKRDIGASAIREFVLVLDATSKIPVGLLFSYNMGELGEFYQCLDTESQDGLIKGKYCLGAISLDSNSFNMNKSDLTVLRQQVQLRETAKVIMNIRTRGESTGTSFSSLSWAICLPSDCTDQDIGDILQMLIGSPAALCQTKEDISPPLTNGAIATIVILAYFAALMVASTICELYYIHINKEPHRDILVAFSIYKNGRALFKISNNSAELSCLNGIKLLSMMWVLIGHVYLTYFLAYPIYNYLDVMKWAETQRSMIIVSSALSVDSFFLVGGLLVVYGFMKAKHNGVEFNIFYFYLHRYIRLTPALAVVVLVYSNLLVYMGSGPRWSGVGTNFQSSCQKYWWSTLLYVQNYVNSDDMCVNHTWYLSVDMQLYILSPLILLPLWRYPKIGVALIMSLILTFIIIPFYVAYHFELSGLLTSSYIKAPLSEYLQKYYYTTHTRAAPWVIGALLGYVLARIKFLGEKRLRLAKLGKPVVFLLWAIVIAVILTCIYAGHSTLRGEDYDKWGNTFYIALVRPAWAISLAWVILACATGYGGPINLILSFPIYQVLNRFTYSIYLLHVAVINLMALALRKGEYFSEFNLAYSFWGLTMFSFGLSVLWVLAFESPMFVIEKFIFKGFHFAVRKQPRTVR